MGDGNEQRVDENHGKRVKFPGVGHVLVKSNENSYHQEEKSNCETHHMLNPPPKGKRKMPNPYLPLLRGLHWWVHYLYSRDHK